MKHIINLTNIITSIGGVFILRFLFPSTGLGAMVMFPIIIGAGLCISFLTHGFASKYPQKKGGIFVMGLLFILCLQIVLFPQDGSSVFHEMKIYSKGISAYKKISFEELDFSNTFGNNEIPLYLAGLHKFSEELLVEETFPLYKMMDFEEYKKSSTPVEKSKRISKNTIQKALNSGIEKVYWEILEILY